MLRDFRRSALVSILRPRLAKVFGIGLNKTGTTSLGAALQRLGHRHTSVNFDLMTAYHDGDVQRILKHAASYDSFEDWPWPLLFRELHEKFPDARFILTTRANPEVWFTSLCKHALRTGPTRFREIAYGYAMPDGHRAHYIDVYNNHSEAVREYFTRFPGSMVELCWERGDGWPELGRFLRIDVPDEPFPHLNKAF